MIKRKHWGIFSKAVLLVLVFLLASEPVLVAAKPEEVDPRQETMDALTASGDLYLTNVLEAVSLSTELGKSVSAIQVTPLTQVSESAIVQARAKALKGAEASAITLGSIDDVAAGVETLADTLYPAFNAFQRAGAGVPQSLREDLIQQAGLTSAEVDNISSGMGNILLDRQSMAANGMPAAMVTQLTQAGFSQAEIDQLATVAGTRGLANTSLTTTLQQFRASQDEWADVRTQLLMLDIQLMGYQIGVRQASGIEPRAVTDAELQEIAQDELRLLVHVAHVQELWGSDPNLDVGEGDWWFIEQYAGRAAERLDALVIESQNRGLVPDLYVLQEMRLLALTAKSGDANYVKAELDGLGELLSYLVGDATFVARQRDGVRGLGYVTARLASHPKLREQVQWPIDEEIKSGAAKNARVRMDAFGVPDYAHRYGLISEQNEYNNLKTLVFIAGLSQFDRINVAIWNEIIALAIDINQQSLADLILAVLSGDTDNPLLAATNMFLGMVPVVNVLTDLFAVAVSDSTFMRAVLFFATLNDIGESLAWLPTLQIAGVTYISGAITEGVKRLVRGATSAVVDFLKKIPFKKAFTVVVEFVGVAAARIGRDLANADDAFEVIWRILSGDFKIWDHFITFAQRVGVDGLIKYGFDEGSVLVGRVLNLGTDLSDEAIVATKRIGKDLAEAGVELSDDAARGVARATDLLGESEARELLSVCFVGFAPGNAKVAAPAKMPHLMCAAADWFGQIDARFAGGLSRGAAKGAAKLVKEGLGEFANDLVTKYPHEAESTFQLIGKYIPSGRVWSADEYEGIAKLLDIKRLNPSHAQIVDNILNTTGRKEFGPAFFRRITEASDARVPGVNEMLNEVNGEWISVKGAAHELEFAETLGFSNITQMQLPVGGRVMDIYSNGQYYELKNIESWESKFTEQLNDYIAALGPADAKKIHYVFRGPENAKILKDFKSAIEKSTNDKAVIDAILANVQWFGTPMKP